jgi:rhodanese-related sulfurtransferase
MQHAPKFLEVVTQARKQIRETNVHEVKRRMDGREKLLLVDTREDSEWQHGHISGAIHIGRGVLERDIERLIPDPATEIILYCGGGYRSALAAESLKKMGYTNIISMDGGWTAWVESSYPTNTKSE